MLKWQPELTTWQFSHERPKYACLNFGDSVWRLLVPESNHVADIQKAAAQAAEAF